MTKPTPSVTHQVSAALEEHMQYKSLAAFPLMTLGAKAVSSAQNIELNYKQIHLALLNVCSPAS